MLKLWKMLGSAAVLAVVLMACSTPQVPNTQLSETPPSFGPTTNLPPRLPAIVETNVAITPPRVQTNSHAQVEARREMPVAPVVSNPTNWVPAAAWVAWEAWSQGRGWGKPERVRNVASWTFELRSSQGILEITAGHRTARWNGLSLELGFAPRLTNGQPYLHALDLSKTFDPLTLRPTLLRRTNRVLVIDAGHGGENLGAKSILCDRYEKEFALDWALRTERLLQNQGWKVYLTRTNDIDISLTDRIVFADRVKADLFISLHFNSTDQPQGRFDQGGLETYCLTPVGMPSSLTRRFDDGHQSAYLNNAFDSDNYYYAARLHRALVNGTQRKDRGVRRARFMGVLRGQNRPAVLLEGGYLTHPVEAQLIASADYRQTLADAVAKALME